MRRRRDPFARCTFVPRRGAAPSCSWCGTTPQPRRPLYVIVKEDDQHGRDHVMRGAFESWGCAEAYHDQRLGR